MGGVTMVEEYTVRYCHRRHLCGCNVDDLDDFFWSYYPVPQETQALAEELKNELWSALDGDYYLEVVRCD